MPAASSLIFFAPFLPFTLPVAEPSAEPCACFCVLISSSLPTASSWPTAAASAAAFTTSLPPRDRMLCSLEMASVRAFFCSSVSSLSSGDGPS